MIRRLSALRLGTLDFGPWTLLAILIALSAPVSAGEVSLNGHVFTLPDGFEIEQIAGPPLVNRPITGAFDEQGRLYVSDSSGSNDPVRKQLAERPHRILRLEDTDGDGRFDRHTVFADKMMFPEGTMWLDGSLCVSAPPTIWKLTDTNGDGVADRREEWLTRTLTGCANDLHGPYAGPDGWIYWCKGAFARQSYQLPGHKPVSSRAAHIFRARRDGSGLEPVMTGGMDNPVDVVFTPGGERIFTTTFLVHPSEGQRDGLIHAIYGGVYGKEHDVINGHPRTGDLMPPLVHLGPAAPCGLVRYESTAFGPEYRDNLFACCFNMRKITRHVLTPEGATFRAATSDFLVSNNLDFHPTDILEDADGSLIVIDTGGWYKLCCPTSQLWKPDILGAIYRIRRKGAPKIDDPRGMKLAWKATSLEMMAKRLGEQKPAFDWDAALVKVLADRLGDSRPAVRHRAIEELGKLGAPAVAILKSRPDASAEARRNALWALVRIDGPEARAAIRAGLSDWDESVRQVATHCVSLRRDREAVPQLLELLKTGTAQNQRVAAEALGRLGDKSAVAALLEAIRIRWPDGTTGWRPDALEDRVLEHSFIYALIEIDDPAATRRGLSSSERSTLRAALIALDQMPGGGLDPKTVAKMLSSPNSDQSMTASWIISRHRDWGDALAGALRERLYAAAARESERSELGNHLARFASSSNVQLLLATAVRDPKLSPSAQRLVLDAMRSSGLKQLPDNWIDVLLPLLKGADFSLIDKVVAVFRAIPGGKERSTQVERAMIDLATLPNCPSSIRLEALAAVPGGLPQVDSQTFTFLVGNLNTDLPVTTRASAAGVLSTARLSSSQLAELTESFKSVGPLEIDRLLAAYENCADEAIGLKLIAALKSSPSLSALRVDSVERRIRKQPASVHAQAERLYRLINVDIEKQRQRITDLLPLVHKGDVRRGQRVFAEAKVACVSCHQFGYKGGHIGPDLTNIGRIRAERDLLEAILFPSASFVRSFEPTQVVTKAGKAYNGLVKSETSDEVVLVTSATETVRVPRDQIEEMRPGTVSIMPAGLDKQLTPQDLADLVAFLSHAK
ncbi:MAG TPA: PVC-type heme-binding CxxCH protein [Planctomycetaceae bacterium]|nr:PVC-type heme-binding CxxCH protein [Planctomycetaceae bacterium]